MNHATPTPGASPATAIDTFRGSRGLFTMVAIDQRDSLRHMLEKQRGRHGVDDAALREFKTAVARNVTSGASGILLDRQYGQPAAAAAQCPVILAADVLTASTPGGPMDLATIDDAVTRDTAAEFGAKALKLLVPWHQDAREHAVDLTSRFMARCRELGLPGVVEGVVRPRDAHTESAEAFAKALISAAADLAATQPDLYKTEVVYPSRAYRDLTTKTALAITDVLDCPWVVLSSGVDATHFPDAVAAAVRGGSSGFLAGRAIWSGAFAAADPLHYLCTEAVRNLEALVDAAYGSRLGPTS